MRSPQKKSPLMSPLRSPFRQSAPLPELHLRDTVNPVREETKDNDKDVSDLMEAQENSMKDRKRFIMRLVNALHSAGNLSFRTERYVEQVALSFGLQALLKIYPTSATLSFFGTNTLAMETYNFRASGGLSGYKLSALDELCYGIVESKDPDFEEANNRLLQIETTPPRHPWWVTCLASGFASFGVTALFFQSSWIGSGFSFLFGLVTYAIGRISRKFTGMPELEPFITSFVVTFAIASLNLNIFDEKLCIFGVLFGSICWLFPGYTITVSFLEIYSAMIIYGSARLTYGIFVAMQLGFGMSLGYRLATGGHDTTEFIDKACNHPKSEYFAILLLPLVATAFSVLIDCSWRQVPGSMFVCGCAYIFGAYIAPLGHIPVDVIPFLSAIVVTFAARGYSSRIPEERPLVYMVVGLFMLVPGGLGVKGMSSMWSGDNQSGTAFTAQMVMVGVSLALGVFVALLPRRRRPVSEKATDDRQITYSASLAAHLADDDGNLPEAYPMDILEPEAVDMLENGCDSRMCLFTPI